MYTQGCVHAQTVVDKNSNRRLYDSQGAKGDLRLFFTRFCISKHTSGLGVKPCVGFEGLQTKRSRGMHAHVVTADQQKLFEKKLAPLFYVSLAPLSRLEHPELKLAPSVIGACPPARKAGTFWLDAAYDWAVDKAINQVRNWAYVCVTMDGWKKKAREQTSPLITIIILHPEGSSLFWKVSPFPQYHRKIKL
jgi:hypothetical protein